jgi:hypothetical protein
LRLRLVCCLGAALAVTLCPPAPRPAAASPDPAEERLADRRLSPAALDRLSAKRLGIPYGHDSGPNPPRLDCQTYVEHVFAEALSPTPAEFARTLQRIQYREGVAKEVERYVYPIPDWLHGRWPARDVTTTVAGARSSQMTKVIDRARFFRQPRLAHRGGVFVPERVQTPYIPRASAAGLEYPDGSVAVFVQHRAGIVAAHCGFLFRCNGVTRLRHASQIRRAVIQESLAAYLQRAPAHIIGLKVLVPDGSRWLD